MAHLGLPADDPLLLSFAAQSTQAQEETCHRLEAIAYQLAVVEQVELAKCRDLRVFAEPERAGLGDANNAQDPGTHPD